MRRVILETPYAGKTDEEIAANIKYARLCVRDCLRRGEAPIASHLLFTQPDILDDKNPEERRLGIEAGFAWREVAEATVVYKDRGVSEGMLRGIRDARRKDCPVEYRKLPGYSGNQT
jgi:hypothetical protein